MRQGPSSSSAKTRPNIRNRAHSAVTSPSSHERSHHTCVSLYTFTATTQKLSCAHLISVPVRLRARAAGIAYDGFYPVRIRFGEFVAQKVQTLFVDDLDGSDAEGTVRFGLDGTDYEIDLTGVCS